MNRDEGILFSGGAAGAEASSGACAERHGIEEVNFTFEGHTIARHRGVRVLNHEELQSGDISLAYVSRLMHRRYADAADHAARCSRRSGIRSTAARRSTSIGAILDDGTVRGGTGWGAEFAKLCNKPLHVFDSGEEKLVHLVGRGLGEAHLGQRFRSSPTRIFTGTGTRRLQPNGARAIDDPVHAVVRR